MTSIQIQVDDQTYTVTKQRIEKLVKDTISDFIYYDRKEDEDTPVTAIEQAIKGGLLTEDDLVNMFRKALHEHLV
jgi:hypothetical protein